ncbi:hypothetical protein HYT02_03995 [Candidatus Gottesmanbacteria bacterium]|nr:hypothetical protein [Candidatus Gottesmanbacteria bacterium]
MYVAVIMIIIFALVYNAKRKTPLNPKNKADRKVFTIIFIILIAVSLLLFYLITSDLRI